MAYYSSLSARFYHTCENCFAGNNINDSFRFDGIPPNSRECLICKKLKEREDCILHSTANYQKAIDSSKKLKNKHCIKNSFGLAIEDSITKSLFSDPTNIKDDAILEAIYCNEPGNSVIAERIFKKLSSQSKHITTSKISHDNKGAVTFGEDIFKDLRIIDYSPKCIIGRIGCGKTTFILHLFRIVIPTIIREELFWIYLDLRESTTNKAGLERECEEKILRTIREEYSSVIDIDDYDTLCEIFSKQLASFSKRNIKYQDVNPEKAASLYIEELNRLTSEKDTLICSTFEYLRDKKGILPILIFDNVDRLPDNIQKFVFQLANHKAAWTKAFTILTLRDETYYKFQKEILDATHKAGKMFFLDPPSFSTIIKKRIDYIGANLKSFEFFDRDKLYKITDVSAFFNVIANSFCTGNLRKSIFLDSLSSSNIRESVNSFITIIESHTLDPLKLIKGYASSRKIEIPFYIIIRSLMLGNYHYYLSKRSIIKNIFDNDDPYGKEKYLLNLFVLIYLNNFFKIKRKDSIPKHQFLRELRGFKLTKKEIIRSTEILHEFKFIEMDDYSFDLSRHINKTDFGEVALDMLIPTLGYLSLIIEDIYLPESLGANLITHGDILEQKIGHTRKFITFLKERLEKEFPLEYCNLILKDYIDKIERSVEQEISRIEPS